MLCNALQVCVSGTVVLTMYSKGDHASNTPNSSSLISEPDILLGKEQAALEAPAKPRRRSAFLWAPANQECVEVVGFRNSWKLPQDMYIRSLPLLSENRSSLLLCLQKCGLCG